MASSKVMASSNSRKSDLSRRSSSTAPSTKSHQSLLSDDTHIKKNTTTTNFVSMTIDGILQDVHGTPTAESTLLDAQITLIDTPAPPTASSTASVDGNPAGASMVAKTVDDVWREIVSGDRLECKEELADDLMTLEDFLAKADAVEEDDLKMPVPSAEGGVFTFDQSPCQALDKVEGSVVGFGNGVEVTGAREGGRRGKRGHPVLEPLDKAAQQKQRRMIKNRESAARSRERKQAYQVELESLAVKLEEENEHLLKEKEERRRDRYKQIMERVIPVVEKRKPPRLLRRVRSLQW